MSRIVVRPAGRAPTCHSRSAWTASLAMLLVLSGYATVAAQAPERPWRETMQLDAPLLAAKRLENARGLIEQEEWEAAIAALTQAAEDFPNSLVSVSHGRYLNVARAARLMILDFPAAGLEAYRQQTDGWAEQQLESALAAHHEPALRQLLASAYASSAGDDALNALAEWAWERGDIPTARRLWTQLIPFVPAEERSLLQRYPDTEFSLPGVHARLILCSLAEGDAERAAGEVSAFREMFPDARGFLAGQDGVLADLLHDLVSHADDWRGSTQPQSWLTFARAPTRDAVVRQSARLGGAVWTLPLKPVYIPRWEHPRAALPEQGLLARYPVTFGEGVFFHDGTTIHGLRLADGKALWPVESEHPTEEAPGKFYPPFPAIPSSLPWTPVIGIPRFTSLVHAGRLYALLGPSVLTLPAGGQQASPTRLVCVNLAQGEGRLEWFHTPEDLFPPGWLPTGSPIAEGANLYVPLLKSLPQVELAVACLRAEDGSVVWQQTIGQALRESLGGRVELGHQLLTLAAGRVYFATDFGAVAALAADDGRLEWVVTYQVADRSPLDHSHEAVMGLLPPVYHEGVLFAKPNDAEHLLAIDARTGFVYWRRPLPGPIVHLLGVVDSTLVISGDHLWGLDMQTGRTAWRFGYDDAAGYGSGRGAIVGDDVYWPTHEELFVVDVHSGRTIQRVRLQDFLGLSGGHVIAAGNRLLIAGRDHLTAFALIDDSPARE